MEQCSEVISDHYSRTEFHTFGSGKKKLGTGYICSSWWNTNQREPFFKHSLIYCSMFSMLFLKVMFFFWKMYWWHGSNFTICWHLSSTILVIYNTGIQSNSKPFTLITQPFRAQGSKRMEQFDPDFSVFISKSSPNSRIKMVDNASFPDHSHQLFHFPAVKLCSYFTYFDCNNLKYNLRMKQTRVLQYLRLLIWQHFFCNRSYTVKLLY